MAILDDEQPQRSPLIPKDYDFSRRNTTTDPFEASMVYVPSHFFDGSQVAEVVSYTDTPLLVIPTTPPVKTAKKKQQRKSVEFALRGGDTGGREKKASFDYDAIEATDVFAVSTGFVPNDSCDAVGLTPNVGEISLSDDQEGSPVSSTRRRGSARRGSKKKEERKKSVDGALGGVDFDFGGVDFDLEGLTPNADAIKSSDVQEESPVSPTRRRGSARRGSKKQKERQQSVDGALGGVDFDFGGVDTVVSSPLDAPPTQHWEGAVVIQDEP